MNAAQRERFTILAEEATEVAQAACKALRFGPDDINPITEDSCGEQLEKELGDLYYVLNWMLSEGDIIMDNIGESLNTKAERMAPYLRHQEDENGQEE